MTSWRRPWPRCARSRGRRHELRITACALAAARVRRRGRRARGRPHGPCAAVLRTGDAWQAAGGRTPGAAPALPGAGGGAAPLRAVPCLRAVPVARAEGPARAAARRLALAPLGPPRPPRRDL